MRASDGQRLGARVRELRRHAGRVASVVVVAAIAVAMWRCNYSGSCTTNQDCTGSSHMCVFAVSDGCSGTGHCAEVDVCDVDGPRLFACGCNNSMVEPVCLGGVYVAPVRSIGLCPSALDAGTDAPPPVFDAGTPPPNGKLLLLHASPDLPTFRVCFATGQQDDGSDAKVAGLAAWPHDDAISAAAGQPFPGIRPGRGETFPDVGFALIAITPFVVRAAAIATDVTSNPNERACDELLGIKGDSAVLTLGVDYWRMNTIAPGKFPKGRTAILGITGCTANSTLGDAGRTKCGIDYGPTLGNLYARSWLVDGVVSDASTAGAQFLHASSAWEGVAGAGDAGYVGTIARFEDLPHDGGASIAFPPPPGAKVGDLAPPSALAVPDLGATPSTTTFTVTAISNDGGAMMKLGLTLAEIQSLSPPPWNPGKLFAKGTNYTFVLLGDPDPATPQLFSDGGSNPQYDGHGVHVIALPSDPRLPQF